MFCGKLPINHGFIHNQKFGIPEKKFLYGNMVYSLE